MGFVEPWPRKSAVVKKVHPLSKKGVTYVEISLCFLKWKVTPTPAGDPTQLTNALFYHLFWFLCFK